MAQPYDRRVGFPAVIAVAILAMPSLDRPDGTDMKT